MGSMLNSQRVLLLGLALGAPSFASAEMVHHKSDMVPVEWKSSADEVRHAVAKPTIDGKFANDGPVLHTVHQQPGVYNPSRPAPAANHPVIDGFKRAGQDLNRATDQTFRDLSQGIEGTAKGIWNGTRNTLDASGTALENAAKNTVHIGNDQYYAGRAAQTAAANRPTAQVQQFQNPALQPPAPVVDPYATNVTNPNYPDQGLSRTTSGLGNGSPQAPLQEAPNVIPQPLYKSFGNRGNQDNNLMTPVPDYRQPQNTNPHNGGNQLPQNYQQPGRNSNNVAVTGTPGSLVPRTPLDAYTPGSTPSWGGASVPSVAGASAFRPVATTETYPSIERPQTPNVGWKDAPQNQYAGPPSSPSTPEKDNTGLVTILLALSAFGNFFGWTTYLDLRNKYRSSLRRTPNSYRNA